MRRFFCSITLGALVFLILNLPASAGIGWCKSDPIILIGGQLADVFTSSTLGAPLKVTGPTQIVVTVPTGINASLVLTDLGFGKGEQVRFAQSSSLRQTATGIEIQVAVYVPATDSRLPVTVEFAPRVLGILTPASGQGTANAWVILKTTL